MELRLTTDHDSIRRLALEAGLEDGGFDDIIGAYGLFEGSSLRACVALRRVRDVFSVEWLAVERGLRRKGIGRRLVLRVAEDAKSLGAKELWALARAPEFFLRVGFVLSSEDESPGPTYAGCAKCPQYRKTCHPKIVALRL